jgi:AraC-like DNA-binding protein
MSYSISTLLIRNLRDVFGENDPARRRAAIDETYTEDCVFYESRGVHRGRDGIDRGLALKSMHENVAAPWTVESLAAACGISRSAFAQKFKDLVGEAPLEYLTNWRMHKAIALLRDEDKKRFGVAKSVGYDSDAAFSKAFKRVFGVAPKRFAGNVPSVTQG